MEKEGYYPFIDGLRGVAILLVVLIHTGFYAGNIGPGSFHFGPIEDFVNSGGRGVQLFFILSAFTLFASSLRRYKQDRHPVVSFYIRRAFRILPLWWVVVLVWAVITHATLSQVTPSVVFVFGFLRFDQAFDLVRGGWSLFVEETFYIFLPLLFARIKNLYAALSLLVGMLVLVYFWTALAINHPIIQTNSFAGLFPFSHWYAFAVGIVAFYVITHQVLSQKLYDRPEKVFLLDIVAASSLLLFFTAEAQWPTLAWFLLLIAAVSAKSIFGRLMRLPLLMRFGKYCYSIYLLHFFILIVLKDHLPQFFNMLHMGNAWVELKLLVLFPIVAAICLLAGFVTFNLVEKNYVDIGRNIIKWLNRSKSIKHGVVAPAPALVPQAKLESE